MALHLTIFNTIAYASPTLSLNSKSEYVLLLEEKLKNIGYDIDVVDCNFDKNTKLAVEQFQRDNNLEVTGIVNNATWRLLKNKPIDFEAAVSNSSKSKTSSQTTALEEIILNNAEIKALQQKLQQLGYNITMIDGEIGNETNAAIKAFQEEHNINITNTIDEPTIKALKNEKLIKIDSNSKSSKNKINKLNYDEVIILQQNLKKLGYEITMIDGEFGNETKAAVEAFQRDNKIEITGNANPETLIALKTAKPLKLDLNEGRLVPFGQILISKSKAEAVVQTAKKYIGVPYVFGGTTPQEGFDCSGFLQYVFKENGLLIPRLADEQYKLGMHAKTTELVAGDLVFFTTYETGASHCGIYLGEGQFLHTSASRGVRIDLLSNIYWAPRFIGAKKIVEI